MSQSIRADYEKIADVYDQARPISGLNVEVWLKLIAQKGNLRQVSTVLDVGCGTGRFSIPIATRLGCQVVGAEVSLAMLAKAKEKAGAGRVT